MPYEELCQPYSLAALPGVGQTTVADAARPQCAHLLRYSDRDCSVIIGQKLAMLDDEQCAPRVPLTPSAVAFQSKLSRLKRPSMPPTPFGMGCHDPNAPQSPGFF